MSPRFKWSEEYHEDEEKNPGKYKNSRLMLELMYTPPFEVLSAALMVQNRLITYKRLTFEIYGAMKFFVIAGPFDSLKPLREGTEIWYMSLGLLFQFNYQTFSPYLDIGGDGIITVGTEVNLHKIYRKPKRRYKLKAKPVQG